jgi:hypothetical protein
MGLFDSYFDPSTYQGGGGFIDRLLSQIGTQSQPSQGFAPSLGFPDNQPSPLDNAQYPSGPNGAPSAPATFADRFNALPNAPQPVNPSGRTFDAAQFDPATYAPNQAQPIGVGGYQMPRLGSADLFQSQVPTDVSAQSRQNDPAALPANAQPTQGGLLPMQPQPQQPQAAPQPSFLQPQHSPGGFGGAMRGIMANASGGPLGWIGGGIAGAMGMGQGTAQDQQRALLNQQYQALRPVLGDQAAMLAVINPEAGKLLISEALSNKQKFVQLKDGMGAEHPAFVSETDQTVNGQPIAEYNKQQGATSSALGNMDLTGKDYLASMPRSEANIVQQMVEGTIAPPSSFALGKQIWAARLAAAKNYDPTFDAANWSGRVAGVKDFSAGKSSEMVRSANQTLHHTDGLLNSMDALNNGDYPMKNYVGNKLNEATGGGAPTAFRLNAHAVAEEMAKVFKGANLSDTEIRTWEQNLSENMSPEQQRAAVGKLRDLLQGSLQALDEKRVASMGQMAADKAGPIIKPEGQKVLQRIDTWLSKGTGAAQGTTPAQTKTGVSWSVVQ